MLYRIDTRHLREARKAINGNANKYQLACIHVDIAIAKVIDMKVLYGRLSRSRPCQREHISMIAAMEII